MDLLGIHDQYYHRVRKFILASVRDEPVADDLIQEARWCEGMPFGDMMRKMTEAKKPGTPFNCAEMMSQMIKMCFRSREKKEGASQETKENPATNL